MRWFCIGDLRRSFCFSLRVRFFFCLLITATQIIVPVEIWFAQQAVGNEITDNGKNSRSILIAQYNDTDAIGGEETGAGRKSINVSTMLYAVVSLIRRKHPSKPIVRKIEIGLFFSWKSITDDDLRTDGF